MLAQQAEGITFPLLTTSTGKKFGKTEEGAVYLDSNRTSPYQMYQYWLQTTDADVVRYLKLFTFLDRERIGELEEEVERSPEQREAQRVLARECTGIVHGAGTVEAVEAASRILFSGSDEVPSRETIALLAREIPSTELEPGLPLNEVLVSTNLAESKGAARKLVEGGGVYLYNERQTQYQRVITEEDQRWPDALLFRAGKKNYHLVLLRPKR
jgi:tyrosyl-tRNA synthetase